MKDRRPNRPCVFAPRRAAWVIGAAGLLAGALRAGPADPTPSRVVTPAPSPAPLTNPGKGWVLSWGTPAQRSPEILALAAVGYQRYNWVQIEPEEGRFNWKPIDDALQAWAVAGKQFAFGVMAANIHHRGQYVTPRWVFDAGCEPRTVRNVPRKDVVDPAELHHYPDDQVIPARWDDPVYLAKLKGLLTALAGRYDGDPRIAWVETRSYGNWGEGHLWPWGQHFKLDALSHDGRLRHIQMHRDAFKKTRVIAVHHYLESDAHYQKAVRLGVGLRDDGVMGFRDGSRTAGALGFAPAAFEWGGTYEHFKKAGTWEKPGRRLADVIEAGRATYVGLARGGADEANFVKGERPLIDRLTNRMGYHFVLQRASVPAELPAGRPATFEFVWRNAGVAPIYVPAHVALALLDEKGQPRARAWLDGCKPASWAPERETAETATAAFAGVPPGPCRLAVGLFLSREDEKPGIRLGIEGGTAEAWYVLAQVVVQGQGR